MLTKLYLLTYILIFNMFFFIELDRCFAAKQSDNENEYPINVLVNLIDYVPDIILEVRYYGCYNFVGERIEGYQEPIALVTKETALALKNVNADLKNLGYCLKVFDAYRPQRAVNHFVKWSQNADDVKMQLYFYPDLDKSVLFDKGYIGRKSGHSRGSTVDLTICRIDNGDDLDMGGTFDLFSEKSHLDFKNLSEEQKRNRLLLQTLMIKYGFKPLDTEWWHFTLINEPYPNTYFDIPVSSKYLSH